jgi:hypothetical protein
MFYDSSEPLNLGQNEIAESAHFFFPGSLLPTPAGNMTSSPHHSISAGAAGAIGAVLTLVVVAVCLLSYIFYRKRQRIARDNVVDPRTEKGHYKPELEGRNDGNAAGRTQPLTHQDMQSSAMPLPVLSNTSELSAFAQHELYGNTRGYHNSQMPVHANTSQIPSFELATHSTQNAVLPMIKRKAVGVAGQ